MDNLWEDVKKKRKVRNSGSKSSGSSINSPAYKKPNIAQRHILPQSAPVVADEYDANDESIVFEEEGDALTKIAALLKTLARDVGHIRAAQDKITERMCVLEEGMENCTAAISIVNDELTKTKQENSKLMKRLGDVEGKTKELSKKLDTQEEQTRRKNVMFFGMKEENKETWDVAEQKIRDLLENTMDIVNASSTSVFQIERAQRVVNVPSIKQDPS